MQPLFSVTIILLLLGCGSIRDEGIVVVTREIDQSLIIACFKLDFPAVDKLIKQGANVNSRFGSGDPMAFQDPWTLGWPMASSKWTPLIALSNSCNYPDPPRQVHNTTEDWEWSAKTQNQVSPSALKLRQDLCVKIYDILKASGCRLDDDDGYGATALYQSCYSRKLNLALKLVNDGARVNTKVGIYIDGTFNVTPLHRSQWSYELSNALIAHARGFKPPPLGGAFRLPAA